MKSETKFVIQCRSHYPAIYGTKILSRKVDRQMSCLSESWKQAGDFMSSLTTNHLCKLIPHLKSE